MVGDVPGEDLNQIFSSFRGCPSRSRWPRIGWRHGAGPLSTSPSAAGPEGSGVLLVWFYCFPGPRYYLQGGKLRSNTGPVSEVLGGQATRGRDPTLQVSSAGHLGLPTWPPQPWPIVLPLSSLSDCPHTHTVTGSVPRLLLDLPAHPGGHTIHCPVEFTPPSRPSRAASQAVAEQCSQGLGSSLFLQGGLLTEGS